jgi:hypothetical protein
MGLAGFNEKRSDSSEVFVMDRVSAGCEPRPAALTLERDLAVMEHLEFRPVCNADYGCCRVPWSGVPSDDPDWLGVASSEHDDVRPMKQDPRECKPLLLATGQHLVPWCFFLNVLDQ